MNGKSTLLSIYYFGGSEICRLPNFSLENNKPLKDLKTAWMIGCQIKTYCLCCSFVLLFRQSFISVAGCWFKPSRWIGKRFWSSLLSNGWRKLVQMRAEPSLLELCRVQPSFCKLLQTVYRLTFSYSKRGWLPLHPKKGVNGWCIMIQWSIYSCKKRDLNVLKAYLGIKQKLLQNN